MRCSRTEAPSLHRRYPASPVLRASPPPSPARPDPRGMSVGACHATGRASRVAFIPLFHACRRHYPGGNGRCSCRSLPNRWQPSPLLRRVGFRITRFEACSAFTRVAARMVTEPPRAALCRRSASDDVVASIIRSDCYRLERQLPGGIRTRWGTAPSSRRTEKSGLDDCRRFNTAAVSWRRSFTGVISGIRATVVAPTVSSSVRQKGLVVVRRHDDGGRQTKLAASSTSPAPVWRATSG